jgi:hypothetical protein
MNLIMNVHNTFRISMLRTVKNTFLIQFVFISPQISQIHGQYNEKNYIDGEKGHLQN